MRYTTMTGRCWNGAQRDSGMIIHAIDEGPYPARIDNPWRPALCGAKPGSRGNGWSEAMHHPAPTCPKCLAKLAKLQHA